MRVLVQRVSSAGVVANGEDRGAIGRGFVLLVGIEAGDERADVDWLAAKMLSLRIFNDADGKMNLDLAAVHGRLLIVSQFTLHAAYAKGARPSYIRAARPEGAVPLYDYFVERAAALSGHTPVTGIFGADMQISLVADGPVTIMLDSKARE
jgi:D-tyrosyl-tRNA(Tyr) deacylase